MNRKALVSFIVIALFINMGFFAWGIIIGVDHGKDQGAIIILDTVNKIIDKQLKSDTSCSDITIIGSQDTNRYILSRKTLLHHDKYRRN